jgi:hypothetical protein
VGHQRNRGRKKFLESNENENTTYQNFGTNKNSAGRKVYSFAYINQKDLE